MSNEQSIKNFTELKEKITNVILGLLLLLGTFVLLNTINPDLLMIDPRLKGVSLEFKYDENQQKQIDSIDTSGITVPPDDEIFKDENFVLYLYHQQGEGGAPAIIYSAQKGCSVVCENPYVTGKRQQNNIQNNLKAQRGSMTPTEFIHYFYKKYKAQEKQVSSIQSQYKIVIEQVAQEEGVSVDYLKTVCMIEAFQQCKNSGAEKHTNSRGYKGLFQFHDKTFKSQKRSDCGDIFNSKCNTLAAARYAKYHKPKWEKFKQNHLK